MHKDNSSEASPRMLALSLTDRQVSDLVALPGTVTVSDNLEEIHPEEYDLVITTGASIDTIMSYLQKFRFCVVFAGSAPSNQDEIEDAWDEVNALADKFEKSKFNGIQVQLHPARRFQITQEAKDLGLEAIINRTCKVHDVRSYLGVRNGNTPYVVVNPLLQEALDQPLVLAATVRPRIAASKMQALWLPAVATDHMTEWVQAAAELWRESAPDAFPLDAEWKKDPAWMSGVELSALEEIQRFDEAEAQRQAAVQRERAPLEAGLQAATASGDRARRLLTDAGDELVAVVIEAFRACGFEVQDMDADLTTNGKRREDLRVSHGDWVALVEVKGYSNGAKQGDLTKIVGRKATFALTEHRIPNAVWYAVNQFRDLPPSSRGPVLASHRDEVHVFGEMEGGLVIDSRELFHAWQHAERGENERDQVREMLKSAVGFFSISR